jgi:hypothetical protein
MIITMIGNIFTPHIFYLIIPCLKCFAKCLDRGLSCDEKFTFQIIQEDYDNKYLEIEFEIDKRYSIILSQILVVMTFSGGLPLMYPIGFLCAFINYWMDKCLFLRCHRKPPLYDHRLSSLAKTILKFSILIHVISFLLIYSND